MWPVALVRIALGYQYLSLVVSRIQTGYLKHAYVSEKLNLGESNAAGGVYFEIFKNAIQSQWMAMTYVLLGIEILIGVSYILGLGVRIASLFGMILSIHMYLYFDLTTSSGQIYLFYVHLLFCLLGAGRCLGFDYYFFKSRRGLLW